MATRRSILYNALKDDGWTPEKKFNEYTVTELGVLMVDRGLDPDQLLAESREPVEVKGPDPDELPGMRQNLPEEVIRVDEQGRQWLQEEVRKPAYPKPRGRRVLKYMETGVETETVVNGEYTETFEVAGNRAGRPSEVKITLPSYQVGIYKDPRFPFKVHCYNGREGFDLFEVQNYFGGAELVPLTVKRVYIENELCYDMRSVIQTIQAEYRQLVLQGGKR